ncbi:hypothetical protein R1flu_020021 [Riccia fluitans]|uniref:Uncharacterized protein n=1 Tax=Riccia fluitans TaxID=41844 RepID=A0ABD1ZKC4_9MARC
MAVSSAMEQLLYCAASVEENGRWCCPLRKQQQSNKSQKSAGSFERKTLLSHQSRTSLLPSPDDAFQKVTGPPEFLKNRVREISSRPRDSWHSAADTSQPVEVPSVEEPRKPLTNGAVIQAKAVLLDLPEQGRNEPVDGGTNGEDVSHRVSGVNMPPAEDAAALLRICLRCGVPKTYSGAKESMVCPVCGDRPAVEQKKASTGEAEKRSGSKIKDKEKNKRMKGQSSHATWKSETEMQLRQHFD